MGGTMIISILQMGKLRRRGPKRLLWCKWEPGSWFWFSFSKFPSPHPLPWTVLSLGRAGHPILAVKGGVSRGKKWTWDPLGVSDRIGCQYDFIGCQNTPPWTPLEPGKDARSLQWEDMWGRQGSTWGHICLPNLIFSWRIIQGRSECVSARLSPVIGREPGRGHREWRGSVLGKQRHLLDLCSVTYLWQQKTFRK